MREKRYVVWFSLLGVLVLLNLSPAAGLLVKAGVRDNLGPFQRLLGWLSERLDDARAVVRRSHDARAERDAMRAELASLRERVLNLEEAARENAALRRQIGFASRSDHRLVLCQVVQRGDASGWWQTLRLDKGEADGIRSDRAVICTRGLVGRTIAVSRHTADVLLMTDPNSRVSCRFAKTGAFGILRGAGVSPRGEMKLEMLYAARPCVMEFIPREHEVSEGDEVVTSGLGGVYPEGLSVGSVAKTEMDSSGLCRRADVTPASDISSLRYVFVVME